jgi:hypothetical protein
MMSLYLNQNPLFLLYLEFNNQQILREKNEENDGEEGGYLNFHEGLR